MVRAIVMATAVAVAIVMAATAVAAAVAVVDVRLAQADGRHFLPDHRCGGSRHQRQVADSPAGGVECQTVAAADIVTGGVPNAAESGQREGRTACNGAELEQAPQRP